MKPKIKYNTFWKVYTIIFVVKMLKLAFHSVVSPWEFIVVQHELAPMNHCH